MDRLLVGCPKVVSRMGSDSISNQWLQCLLVSFLSNINGLGYETSILVRESCGVTVLIPEQGVDRINHSICNGLWENQIAKEIPFNDGVLNKGIWT